jgi:hypothetical protein
MGMVSLLLAVCWSCLTGDSGTDSGRIHLSWWQSSGSCAEAVPDITAIRVSLAGTVGGTPLLLNTQTVPVADNSLVVSAVPLGEDVELTVTSWGEDKNAGPVHFGRTSRMQLETGDDRHESVALHRYAAPSCIEGVTGRPNVMFPTATLLPDGRVLIAGGFAKLKDAGPRFELTGPNSAAYVYDPADGSLRQTKNLMNKGRGAHAAAYLPASGLMLLVGGSEQMYLEKDHECFPWYFQKDKAGSVAFSYELFDPETEEFLQWDSGWPDISNDLHQKAYRIFPMISVNSDGSALVTGGGTWPSCETEMEMGHQYQIAEFYRPATEDEAGGFVDTHGALTMTTIRSGHAAVTLTSEAGLSQHLFWGGTAGGSVAETYRESSAQMDGVYGAFSAISFADDGAYKRRPYFHTLTALGDHSALLIGGVRSSKGQLKVPSANDAYHVRLTDDALEVKAIEDLGVGRYFHTAATSDGVNAFIFGGFSSTVMGEDDYFSDIAASDLRLFRYSSEQLWESDLDQPPFPLGGAASVGLASGCVLMAGGVDSVPTGLEFGPDHVPLKVQVFCPSYVCPSSMWEGGCYGAN